MRRFFVLFILLVSNGFAAQDNFLPYCRQVAKNSHEFKAFKRHPQFTKTEEKTTVDEGWEHIKVLQREYPHLYRRRHFFCQNDEVGNPILHDFGSWGKYSPTTLLYARTVGDLQKQFPSIHSMSICEIGGGYGAQCLLLSLLGGFKNYTIIDHPDKLALIRKYLEYHNVHNVNYVDENALSGQLPFDLIFSNKEIVYGSPLYVKLFTERRAQAVKNGFLWLEFSPPQVLAGIGEIVRILKAGRLQGGIFMDDTQVRFSRRRLLWKEPTTVFDEKYTHQPVNSYANSPEPHHGVTFGLSGGRLGDNLTSYLHAKWVSMKKNIPLFYRPFEHSTEFAFSDLEPRVEWPHVYRHLLNLKSWGHFDQQKQSTLFTVLFFPETKAELQANLNQFPFNFETDWYDRVFRSVVKKMLAPKKTYPKLDLPKDCVRIAVHVRLGGGYDPVHTYKGYPLKFPPENYYARQIRQIAEIYPDKQLYVYIFTDDLKPEEVMTRIASVVNNPRIAFDCRKSPNGPFLNILEDFYGMQQFDCLIRPESNFSIVAGFMKDYEVLIFPTYSENENIVGTEIRFAP